MTAGFNGNGSTHTPNIVPLDFSACQVFVDLQELVVGEAPPGRSPAMVGVSAGKPPEVAAGDVGGAVDFSEYLTLHRRATKAIPFK